MDDSFRAVLQSFPRPAYPTISSGIGVRETRIAQWNHRDFIPPEYWEGIVALAVRLTVADVTLERLARLAAVRRADGQTSLPRREEAPANA